MTAQDKTPTERLQCSIVDSAIAWVQVQPDRDPPDWMVRVYTGIDTAEAQVPLDAMPSFDVYKAMLYAAILLQRPSTVGGDQ